MDQSKSNNTTTSVDHIPLPKRSLTTEFFVGLFMMFGVACAGYLAVGLGGIQIGPSDKYTVYAEFDNISGLKYGASVEIAGVQVGEVAALDLKDPAARLTLKLDKAVKLHDDDIASIRTKGIIGDRYVKISRGASSTYIPEGGTLLDTESVVDIEDIIGKIVHNLTGEKEPKEDSAAKK